jgi:hypothetical protein
MKKKIIKQKKTNTRKNNKKTKKNKTLIGGRPKINFPYTYFNIDYNIFMKYSSILNSYLNGQTNACNDISLGKNPEFTHSDSPFLSNSDELCIIVLKYDDAFTLSNNNDLLGDLNFLNKILGHAKLIYYKSLSLVGIYNVCLHTFNIIRDPQGAITTQRKESKPGYGTVLFNCIYTSILLLKVDFNTIWLGIDIKNAEFTKVAWLYTSKGFSNPIISNISPDGKTLPIYFIQLTNNKTYVNNKDDALIPYHETIDLYYQIRNSKLGEEGIFSFKFSFDKTAILSLRLMPFLSFSENKDVVGIEEYYKQRETAGRFLIYKTNDNKNSVSYVLSLETISEQSIKYIIGDAGSVDVIEGERVFHTHPYLNYELYKSLIGPPSGGDIMIFLQSIVNDIKKPMTQPKQFSSIISIEGIYIISLSIDGIRQLKNGIFPFLNQNSYEYPMSERYYDWDNYSSDTTIQVDTVKNQVEKYFNWFNKVNASFDNFFQIIFMPWNKLDEKTIFQIHYYNGNRLNISQMNKSTQVYPQMNLPKTVPPQTPRDNLTTTGRNTNLPQPYSTKVY